VLHFKIVNIHPLEKRYVKWGGSKINLVGLDEVRKYGPVNLEVLTSFSKLSFERFNVLLKLISVDSISI